MKKAKKAPTADKDLQTMMIKTLEAKVSALYKVIKDLASCQDCFGSGTQWRKFSEKERDKPCLACNGTGMSRVAREKLEGIK